jgi:hypothetical protein
MIMCAPLPLAPRDQSLRQRRLARNASRKELLPPRKRRQTLAMHRLRLCLPPARSMRQPSTFSEPDCRKILYTYDDEARPLRRPLLDRLPAELRESMLVSHQQGRVSSWTDARWRRVERDAALSVRHDIRCELARLLCPNLAPPLRRDVARHRLAGIRRPKEDAVVTLLSSFGSVLIGDHRLRDFGLCAGLTRSHRCRGARADHPTRCRENGTPRK